VQRGDVDDPPPAFRLHRRNQRLRQKIGRGQIEIDRRRPAFERDFARALPVVHARRRDQNIGRAEGLRNAPRDVLHLRRIGQIRRNRRRSVTRCMPPFFEPVRAAGHAHNLCPGFDKRRRQMPPDARTGPGHASHTAGNIETLRDHGSALLAIFR
jgi:hypothetical protein